MTTTNLTETVRRIVVDSLDVAEDFALTDSFDDMGADSLDQCGLLISLEDVLGLDLPEHLKTPQQVIDYAWSQLSTPA